MTTSQTIDAMFIEKIASVNNKEIETDDFSFNADHKIPAIEDAFHDPIAKKVAYMIATSHEYKTPNVKAALSFVKNYKWEVSNARTNDLQGINKPIIQDKVDDMAKQMKGKKPSPLICVNQFHGIRPQTAGKKILVDGHHRIEACKANNVSDVPIYKGTYTGKAEKSFEELREKTASNIINEMYKQARAKVYAVDFDGTIVENKFPFIGKVKPKTVDFMKKVHGRGDHVIIWTSRDKKYLEKAEAFLKKNGVPYHEVNQNSKFRTGSPKIIADHYIDDKAVHIDDLDRIASDQVDEIYKEAMARWKSEYANIGSAGRKLLKEKVMKSPDDIAIGVEKGTQNLMKEYNLKDIKDKTNKTFPSFDLRGGDKKITTPNDIFDPKVKKYNDMGKFSDVLIRLWKRFVGAKKLTSGENTLFNAVSKRNVLNKLTHGFNSQMISEGSFMPYFNEKFSKRMKTSRILNQFPDYLKDKNVRESYKNYGNKIDVKKDVMASKAKDLKKSNIDKKNGKPYEVFLNKDKKIEASDQIDEIYKQALNASKARDMAKKVGLIPEGQWKWALRKMRGAKGELLKGKELAKAKEGMGVMPNNIAQKLHAASGRQGHIPEVGILNNTKNKSTGLNLKDTQKIKDKKRVDTIEKYLNLKDSPNPLNKIKGYIYAKKNYIDTRGKYMDLNRSRVSDFKSGNINRSRNYQLGDFSIGDSGRISGEMNGKTIHTHPLHNRIKHMQIAKTNPNSDAKRLMPGLVGSNKSKLVTPSNIDKTLFKENYQDSHNIYNPEYKIEAVHKIKNIPERPKLNKDKLISMDSNDFATEYKKIKERTAKNKGLRSVYFDRSPRKTRSEV